VVDGQALAIIVEIQSDLFQPVGTALLFTYVLIISFNGNGIRKALSDKSHGKNLVPSVYCGI